MEEGEQEDLAYSFSTLMTSVQDRLRELKEKEKWWIEIEEKMKYHAEIAAKKVTLDIGGQRFVTTKETLLSCKGSFFEAMLGSGHWKPDEDGVYFIDRSPVLFPIIMDYLRYGKVFLVRYPYDVTEELKAELDFYQIKIPEIMSPQLGESQILKDAFHRNQVLQWIECGEVNITLLYRASRDGFESSNFHKLCDDMGSTLVIIQTTAGKIFGGYSSTSWDSSNQFKDAAQCFVFSTNPLKRYLARDLEQAIYCKETCGPIFGTKHDLYICNRSNQMQQSSSGISSSSSKYKSINLYASSSMPKIGSYCIIDGEKEQFLVSEIEVFLIE